jgi:hypothetical protein
VSCPITRAPTHLNRSPLGISTPVVRIPEGELGELRDSESRLIPIDGDTGILRSDIFKSAEPWALAEIPFVKRLLSPSYPMARAYYSGRRPQWPSTVREVVENIEPVNGRAIGYPTPTVGGPGAPSCYRISLLSGSLEVTARLKSADDLELLVKVLEANKPLFAKADRLASEVLTLTQELAGSAPSVSSAQGEAAVQT